MALDENKCKLWGLKVNAVTSFQVKGDLIRGTVVS